MILLCEINDCHLKYRTVGRVMIDVERICVGRLVMPVYHGFIYCMDIIRHEYFTSFNFLSFLLLSAFIFQSIEDKFYIK